MAESSKEELLQLIKRFGAYITLKMSNLFSISFHNLDSRSVGAIAGLAVAIVFTWRLFRSPSGTQRRQPKRPASTASSSVVSSQSNSALIPSGVCSSSSEDLRAQNVVDEFFQPVKPTLGQIVRQKLSEGRKVTCRLLGVILEESSPEEIQVKQATKKVLSALENAGVFTSGGLVKDKDSRSVGAIAGLAVAIVFTWRLFRSPSGTQRRQPKRPASTASSSVVSSQSNSALIPSGVCSSSSEDLRAQNVVDEFFQPVKPTLGQIVRQKLSEGRKVTCRLLGVILEESSPEEIQKQATVRSSVLEVLLEITKFCDLYLMERVIDDESEKKVLSALENAGVFTSGGLVKDKVLFCSTENGRASFVRQLEPDWHIDSNHEIVSQLSRFIKYQLHISGIRPERTAANVFSSPSLEQFFGCI